MTRARNLTAGERCGWCEDSGWVELAGSVKIHGTAYSRGSAPCKWCERGAKVWQRRQTLRQKGYDDAAYASSDRYPVETDYSEADVVAEPESAPVPLSEAKRYLAAIRAQWAQPRPDREAASHAAAKERRGDA